MKYSSPLLSLLLILSACHSTNNTVDDSSMNQISSAKVVPYEIVKIHKHDTTAYTQGLEWLNDNLIEGTGNYGKSILHMLDANMKPLDKTIKLPASSFGEGITQFKNKIYQLTWKEHKVYVYNAKTWEKINELYWPYEGWGLTHNDTSLIVSTGGSNIYFVNPDNFSIQKTVGVFNQYGYLSDINELEFIEGQIAANLYLTNDIIFIDPLSGKVNYLMNFDQLLSEAKVNYQPTNIDPGYVLNGIAYHPTKKTIFITGKCWPIMAEIKLK